MRRLALCLLLLSPAACQRELALEAPPPPVPAVEPFDVDPPIAQAAPGVPVELELVGGVPPFAFEQVFVALQEPALEGSIQTTLDRGAIATIAGRTLTFQALVSEGDYDEKIALIDAAGAEATAEIRVGSALQITPTYAFVNASGRASVTANGGKPPYELRVKDDAAGAAGAASTWLQPAESPCEGVGEAVSVTSASGTLMVASVQGETEIELRDALRLEDPTIPPVTAKIVRGPALRMTPFRVELAPGAVQDFEVSGGDPPYTFWLSGPGADGAAPLGDGGQLPPGLVFSEGVLSVTSEFDPPGDAERADYTLKVEGWSWKDPCKRSDAALRLETSEISIVVRTLRFEPPPETVPGSTLTLRASGGTPPYTFSFQPRGNFSGGTLTADGTYVAGRTTGVSDLLQVTDATPVDAAGPAQAVTAEIAVRAPGVPAMEWQSTFDAQRDDYRREVPALGRQLVAGGLAFSLSAEGELEVRGAPPGRLLELVDANGDGLADVLVLPRDGRPGVQLYLSTIAGDFVWGGGGSPSSMAAVVQTETRSRGTVTRGPDRYFLGSIAIAGGGPDCPLAAVTRDELRAGALPAACAIETPYQLGPHASLLGLGPNRLGVASDTGLDVFTLSGAGLLTLEQFCAPLVEQDRTVDPVAADLDADGLPDLAHLVLRRDGRRTVHACLSSIGSVEYDAPDAGSSLFVGGETSEGRARLLLASAVNEGPSRPSLLTYGGAGFTTTPLDVFGEVIGAGDLDGDARHDVLLAEAFGTLRLLRGDPDGGFERAVRVRIGPAARYELFVTDLDADRQDELVATTEGLTVAFAATTRTLSPDPARPDQPALARIGDTAGTDVVMTADAVAWQGTLVRDLLVVRSTGELARLPWDAEAVSFGAPVELGVGLQPGWGRPRAVRLRADEAESLFVPLLDERLDAVGFVLLGADPITGEAIELQRGEFPGFTLAQGDRALVTDVDGDGRADLVVVGRTDAGQPVTEGVFVGWGTDGVSGRVELPTSRDGFTQFGGPPEGVLPDGEQPLLSDPERRLVYRCWVVVVRQGGPQLEVQPGVHCDAHEVETRVDRDGPAAFALPSRTPGGDPATIPLTTLKTVFPTLVELGPSTDDERTPHNELLVSVSSGPDAEADGLLVVPLDDAGLPLVDQDRLLRLARPGVSARWLPLRTTAAANPDLAVSFEAVGELSAPELLLLRNSFGPKAEGSPPPFAP